ncbi:helix-turn-helix transcriptional regulator [Ruegeria profundi]|uniref:helix-turn-helix transcriptional regulator n=1 Tax=Ruegeria profundi TaxID=1685378 RepID=UPI00147015E1|nr:AraC family transcriptional regulator [Ruegeria profundi]
MELATSRRSVTVDPHRTLYICTFLSGRRARYRMGGRLIDREEFGAGEALVQPVGVDFNFEMMTETRSLGLFVPQDIVRCTLGERVLDLDNAFDQLVGVPFRSSVSLSLLERLRGDVVNASPHGTFVGDEILRALVAELFTLAHRETPASRTVRYALSDKTWDSVERYVRTHLEERMTITDLAHKAGLPAAEFTASLKKAKGLTPYQLILQIRLQEARGLIVQRDLSLAEIAYRCGFSSQSHMTTVFSQKLGVTPAAIRRAAC